MGTFAISCPECGNYVTAYSGFRGLFQKRIKCSNCHHVIDIKSNRMVNVVCPSCNNSVMYDQSKRVPKCPVCHKEILPDAGQKMISIRCPTCRTMYSMAERTANFTCPLCDSVIDVQKEVAALRANAGMTSLIEYDPGDKDWLVYKHPIKNFSNGSQLIVRPMQQALLIEAGEDSHLFEMGQYTMDTANFPWMEKAYKLSDGDTKGTFQSTIYFFNLRTITNDVRGKALEWFVKKSPVMFTMQFEGTTRTTNVVFNIGCGGTYDIAIVDARKLYLNLNSVVAGMNISSGDTREYGGATGILARTIKSKISSWGGEILANTFRQLEIGIFELSAKRSLISQAIEEKVNIYLDGLGLKISNLLVDSFATPEDDPGDPGYKDFLKLRTLASSAAVQQEDEIHKQDIEQQRRITQREKLLTEREALGFEEIEAQKKLMWADAEARSRKMIFEAEAAGLKMKGGNYAMETAREVGKEAMKNGIVSENGGTSGMGEMAQAAVTLGTMGNIIGMTQRTVGAAFDNSTYIQNTDISTLEETKVTEDSWDCPKCGTKENVSRFCPVCGCKKPEYMEKKGWDCLECGSKGNKGNFCPNCGTKKPDATKKEKWNCPKCGVKDNEGKFCMECGCPKPEKHGEKEQSLN